jgi:UDP-galactopyranose mutase
MKLLVIGAGFSGAVLARQLAESLQCRIDVWDERSHIGGNCHTERDPATGVMVHQYGPHIFNTDNDRVWKYVQEFGDFRPFVNRVKAVTTKGVFSMPINLLTINQFFGRAMSPDEAREFVASLGDQTIKEPANFEEQAMKMLGRDLYETFFKGYTIKQWGCDPRELPASVLKRLPVRFNYDDNYYNKKYQGIPAEGYSEVISKILDHPLVTVQIGKRFAPEQTLALSQDYAHLFYTGPLDAFFGHREGRLGYRTVLFEKIETEAEDYQGNAVVNYPDMSVPYTRVHEHKHFAPWEKHDKTSAYKEFSKETEEGDVPYYPKRLASDKAILAKYRVLGEETASGARSHGQMGLSFLGRLATYRYMDMETVIGEALEFSDKFIASWQAKQPLPVFPNSES